MRLHSLTVSAFGPFAGTERVDFDELNDAGLFLLTGPTGAGKSSLLDAVCFALYGQVPGARGVKSLKSQHAPGDARPEVVLDFSVRDRRFVVRRSPEWSRPKKRGAGLLTEKASASVIETTGGVEHFLSSRAAEVGLLVGDLMGMSAAQFVQVALLPQGEFQTFLRASSQERHDVLQHLFRTDRFARIEEWVHEHSRGLKERAGKDGATVQRLLDTVADRSGTTTPEDLAGDALAQAAADGRVLPWAAERLAEAEAALLETDRLRDAAAAHLTEAHTRHGTALRRREQGQRRAAAGAVLQTLADTEVDAAAGRAALEADERAARCRPLLAILEQAEGTAVTALTARDRALRELTSTLPAAPGPAAAELTAGHLGRLLDDTRAQLTRLETLLPRETAARTAARDLETAREQLATAEAELAATAARSDAIPAELDELTVRLEETTARAVRHDALALSLEAARHRHAAAVGLVAARAEVVALADAHRDARDRALTAREHRQTLAERRLAGMAAELAGGLTEGSACQVCGSTTHPEPARPADDAVTEADQDTAEQRVATLTDRLDAAARALQHAEHRRDAFAVAAEGRSTEEAGSEMDALTADLADAERALAQQAALRRQLDATRSEQSTLADRQATTAAGIAGLRQSVTGLEETVRSVAAELAAATGVEDGTPLHETVAVLRRHTTLVADTLRVVETAEQASTRAADLREQTVDAAAEQGFDSVDAVRAGLLDPAAHRRLRGLLDERATATARAQAVLEDTDADDDVDCPAEELTALAAALAQAEAAHAEASREAHLAQARVEAIRSLVERLEQAVLAWAPLRDESLRAESMAKLVRGMGHDNQLQMRLSAYVLATRLDQVVAAANERLAHMRDQRYLLQRTDRAARKGSQAGLGLEVVDQWTGDARAPSTLSGGETFVVSLSLALGLADVVTQEAGGTEIETLFVDEGFGTLDADTLDDVMDRLDGLRAGGRTVGVVSHVSELRNRIPTQVHVRKGRSGSTLAVTTLVG